MLQREFNTALPLIPLRKSLLHTPLGNTAHILSHSQLRHLIDIFICLIEGFRPRWEEEFSVFLLFHDS